MWLPSLLGWEGQPAAGLGHGEVTGIREHPFRPTLSPPSFQPVLSTAVFSECFFSRLRERMFGQRASRWEQEERKQGASDKEIRESRRRAKIETGMMNNTRYVADRERHEEGARQRGCLTERNNSKIGKCEKPQNK